MTTNQTISEAYERPADSEPAAQATEHSSFRLPVLFWAGLILFAANFVVLCDIWLSPRLEVTMYGEAVNHTAVYYRPSPFAEKVERVQPARMKRAPKVHAVAYVRPEPASYYEWEPAAERTYREWRLPAASALRESGNVHLITTARRTTAAAQNVPAMPSSGSIGY